MKKLIQKLAVVMLLVCCFFMCDGEALAVDTMQEIVQYGDGTYAEITLTEDDMMFRTTTKTGTKTYTYKSASGDIIFTYTLKTYFQYDGSTSRAVTCSTTYNIVKSGWSKKSDSHYCSGNKAYGTAKFSNSSTSRDVSLTITCSKDGKIS